MDKIKTTAFLGVFEEKLQRQKIALQKELEVSKSDRRIDWMKSQIKACKKLRNLIREMKNEMDVKCPHCGETL
jgi:uncharacterized membrane-anchored protein YjiN (DUF445 family)|tara:strand:+ start:251 stop:469 length:219 start_codon:yes stop_codon:yes gene_type:complete